MENEEGPGDSETRGYDHEKGEWGEIRDEFYLYGDPAVVDAVVVIDGEVYALARSETNQEAVHYRSRRAGEEIAEYLDAEVYEIDAE